MLKPDRSCFFIFSDLHDNSSCYYPLHDQPVLFKIDDSKTDRLVFFNIELLQLRKSDQTSQRLQLSPQRNPTWASLPLHLHQRPAIPISNNSISYQICSIHYSILELQHATSKTKLLYLLRLRASFTDQLVNDWSRSDSSKPPSCYMTTAAAEQNLINLEHNADLLNSTANQAKLLSPSTNMLLKWTPLWAL